MRRQASLFRSSLIVAIAAICLSCSRQDRGSLPKVYPVNGTLLVNGAPEKDVTVSFHLVGGGRSAVGITDADGRFTLSTFQSHDGAVPGEYRVGVSKYSQRPANYPEPRGDDDPNYVEFVPKNLLPEKYEDPQKSGLTATITEGKNQVELAIAK